MPALQEMLITLQEIRVKYGRHINEEKTHVECMDSEKTPKCLLNSELSGVHRRGRPRKRWLQDVKDVIR
jgi:hypothetical protein